MTNDKETTSNAIGRPTVMTVAVIRKLEEAFLFGCTDLEACFSADISKTALYEYQIEHPEFTERKEKLKENPVFLARKSVIEKLPENGELALKFLERKKKDEFGTKQDINLGGQADNPLQIEEVSSSEERLTVLLAKARLRAKKIENE